jgi:hypothetical protein
MKEFPIRFSSQLSKAPENQKACILIAGNEINWWEGNLFANCGNRMNGRIGGERAKCRKCHGHVLQPRAGRAGCASYI